MNTQHQSTLVRKIVPHNKWSKLNLPELWEYRELFWLMLHRALSARYRQMALGVLWTIIEPLASIGLLIVVFGFLLRVPTEGYPYPIFAFAALIPWWLFSKGCLSVADSLRENTALISKVYFPRIILPLTNICRDAVDQIVNFFILLLLVLFLGYVISFTGLFDVMIALIWAFLLALGIGLTFAVIMVKYRDVRFILSIGMQVLFYASPIIYSATAVPERFQLFYQANPIYWMIAISRHGLLGSPLNLNIMFYASIIATAIILILSAFIFARFERMAVDVQ